MSFSLAGLKYHYKYIFISNEWANPFQKNAYQFKIKDLKKGNSYQVQIKCALTSCDHELCVCKLNT